MPAWWGREGECRFSACLGGVSADLVPARGGGVSADVVVARGGMSADLVPA